jgi:sarcosine oxidase delta subunit
LDTKEYLFLRNQQETKISEGYNLINGAKLWYQMMRTSWSRGHATHTSKTSIPGKPSKSGLIEVWHKDNLYLDTTTIGNGKP